MKIIRITTENEISIHEFPKGSRCEQNMKLKELIGPSCEYIEHIMPRRLYTELGASNRAEHHPGTCANMLVDEEFYRHKLPENIIGSWLYETDKHGHPILGNILIAGEVWSGDGVDFCGLSEEQFSLLYPKFEEIVKKARKLK